MSEEDKAYFDGLVHSLRSNGWSKSDAEDEALERLHAKWFPDKDSNNG